MVVGVLVTVVVSDVRALSFLGYLPMTLLALALSVGGIIPNGETVEVVARRHLPSFPTLPTWASTSSTWSTTPARAQASIDIMELIDEAKQRKARGGITITATA